MSGLVYVNILADSLQRKKSALKSILELTKEQQSLLKGDCFRDEEFKFIIEKKQRFIKQLDDLDAGFETIYRKVNAELEADKFKYKEDIVKMQHLITEITDLSVEVQALEKQNKIQMEIMIANRKEKLRSSKMSNQGVSSYYRNMANTFQPQSFYVDRKK